MRIHPAWWCVLAAWLSFFPSQSVAETQWVKVVGRSAWAAGSLGGSTTVIDAETIRAHRHRDLNEALSSVPGLHVVTSGGRSGQTSVFLRGSESDHAPVFIDGVRVNDPSTGNIAALEYLQADNIKRVVVTRGPQSARYGASAIGGAIHIETKKGGGAPERTVNLEVATQNQRTGGVSFSGAHKRLDYFFGAAYRRADGESLTPRRLRAGGRGEDDAWRNLNFDLRLGLDLEEAGEFDLSYGHVEGRNEYDARAGDSFEARGYRNDSDEHRVVLNYKAPEVGGVTPQVKVSRYRRLWRDIQPARDTRYRGERTAYELGGAFSVGDKTTAFVGYENRLAVAFTDAQFGALDDTMRSEAVYALAEYDWSDDTVLSASWRHEDAETHDAETAEQYGVHWAFPQWGLHARANYATAFKTPSAIERLFGSAGLETERARGWDLSVDKDWAGCNSSLAYFSLETRELIEYNFATQSLENIGRARSEGIEASTRCRLSMGLRLQGHYGQTRAFRRVDGGRERLPRRPLRDAALDAVWEFPSLWTLSARLDYTGPRTDIARDTFATVRRGGYTLAHLSVSREIVSLGERAEAYLRVGNLFDKDYEAVDGYAGEGLNVHFGVMAGM